MKAAGQKRIIIDGKTEVMKIIVNLGNAVYHKTVHLVQPYLFSTLSLKDSCVLQQIDMLLARRFLKTLRLTYNYVADCRSVRSLFSMLFMPRQSFQLRHKLFVAYITENSIWISEPIFRTFQISFLFSATKSHRSINNLAP